MITTEVIEGANIGDNLLYQGADYQWYSGIIIKIGSYNGRPITETAGYLDVQPTDKRLSGPNRRLWDSSGNIYIVPETAISGTMPDEELKKLLEDATPDSIRRFYCDRIMGTLSEIRANYQPTQHPNR